MKCILRRRASAPAALQLPVVIALTVFTVQSARSVEPDIPRTQSAAERGSIQQQIELAAAYFSGKGVARDEKQAAYWYEKAANSGDPAAQLQIGFFYEAGIGVQRDSARAAAWFERAVAGGSIAAKVNLAVAYMWGTGVRKDPELAAQLLQEAADKGSGPAACYLADAYYYGIGVPKDLDKTKHWLEVGAKRHDPQAELGLAILLLRNKDRSSEDRAIKLLRDSAKTGYIAAKHELALRLIRRENPSVPQEAFDQLLDASSRGFWKSTLVLGVLYRDGRGVPRDPEAAYVHFRIATLQGGEPAEKMLKNDLRTLHPAIGESRLRELDAKAADWMSTHNRKLEFIRYPGGDKNFPTFALAYPEDGMHAGRLFPVNDSEDPVGETFQP